MASQAAIRAGAGYATAAVPGSLEPIFEAKLTEVMTLGVDRRGRRLDVRRGRGAILERAESAGCVVLGPGARPRRLGRRARPATLAPRDLLPAADRRRRAQRSRRSSLRAARRPRRGRLSSPRMPASSAGCSARVGARSRPSGSHSARARGRRRPGRSSCSRATTRSSPTASASRSTPLAGAGPRHGGHRRRALGDDRGADRSRYRAVRGRLRRRLAHARAGRDRRRSDSARRVA